MGSRVRRLLAAALAVTALGVACADSGSSTPGSADASMRVDPCGERVPKPGGGFWECTFADNFDGTELDPDRWSTQDTAKSGFRNGLTCYQGDRNVRIRSGLLRLKTRAGPPVDCSNPYGTFITPYTGGLVTTRGHFSQTYGRFEVRASFPRTHFSGLHGAFWMYPATHTYGKWPASGEIDVAEWWSEDATRLLPSLHYTGRSYHADSGWQCRVSNPRAFHVYTLLWYPTVMRFFIDGSMCFSRKWAPEAPLAAPQPFDKPFGLILSMGVGTGEEANRVTSETELPATLRVDYVKAWR